MAKKKKFYDSMGGSFSGMPQKSYMKDFPKVSYLMSDQYPSSLSSIDAQMNKDISGAKKQPSKSHKN